MTAPAVRRASALARSLGALLMLAALGTALPAQAQEFGRIQETKTNTAYFYYAQPGEATVQVSLWGVPQPGLYEIPDSTDLDRLLTLAGGIPMQERQENRKPPRITVRLYRPDRSREEPLVEARIQKILDGKVDAPPLRENDIVVVETVQPSQFTWQDGLSIVSTAASLTLLFLRILRFSD
jgi:hypothetical protein